jgi:hypothetical protein
MSNIFYINDLHVIIVPDIMDVLVWINNKWYFRIDPFGRLSSTNIEEYSYNKGEIFFPQFNMKVKLTEDDLLEIQVGNEIKTVPVFVEEPIF